MFFLSFLLEITAAILEQTKCPWFEQSEASGGYGECEVFGSRVAGNCEFELWKEKHLCFARCNYSRFVTPDFKFAAADKK
jgi:hypothetical protein